MTTRFISYRAVRGASGALGLGEPAASRRGAAVWLGLLGCLLACHAGWGQTDLADKTTSPAYTPPAISIQDHPDSVTLSWKAQASPTELLAGSGWSPQGRLLEPERATDRSFHPVTDAGAAGEEVRFELNKRLPGAFFVPQPAAGPTGEAGLRLDGTFIQYQTWMMKMDTNAWQQELDAMRRAGLRMIFLQWHQYNQNRFLPAEGATNDVTETVMAYADAHGLKVFPGLAMDDGWWTQSTDATYLKQAGDTSCALASELWARYGHHRSFAGWYLPQESWDGSYTDAETITLRAFFRRVSDHCKQLSGPKPVSFAPFYSGSVTADTIERFYKKFLEGAGLDILMLQDGVGARGWDKDVEDRVIPYFRAVRNACVATGVAFWSDLESFRLIQTAPDRFGLTDIARLTRQLAAEAPFVEQFITFDFFHYLSPYRGAAQQALYADYLKTCVDRPFFPAFGRSVEVDPNFGYYRDRSAESIASEIRASGYSVARYILTADSNVRPDLIAAFHRAGIGVWYSTFANGTYSTNDLPPGWEAWRMVTRSDLLGKPLNDGYTRLCLNHPGYRAWKKAQMANMLTNQAFEGVDLMEPHWPEYPGIESPAYACFCPQCLAAFRQQFPEEPALPDILNPAAPLYPTNNPALWQKWLSFRHASLTGFLDDLVNGPQGIRATAPGRLACVWTLALTDANGLQRVLEDSGEDPTEIARTVKPDLFCLQTHWPDWIRADLLPTYVNKYAPFVQAIRTGVTNQPVMIQADTGSQTQNRRNWVWIRAFEQACTKLGVQNTTIYEYFIGLYMYTEAPRIVGVKHTGERINLTFSKRLDQTTAEDVSHYELSSGRITALTVDGNRVRLTTEGITPGTRTTITVRGLKDAYTRRLYQDRPAAVLTEQMVPLDWQE